MTCTIFQTAVSIVHHYHVQQNYLLFNYFFAVILWCYFDLAYDMCTYEWLMSEVYGTDIFKIQNATR